MRRFLDDFKAQTRQYAKRQNIWHRKEEDYVWVDVMGGDSGPKRLFTVVNRIVDYLKMDR
jgi:tRNA A37 N6-isopentenylltransferase MiaA